jgi:precorrin-2 dehydrogenase/sirohydrochlorin ferrochelatase
MLIDLVLDGKRALVVGEGQEPEFKALKLVESKSDVTVVGKTFSEGLRRLAARKPRQVHLVAAKITRRVVLKIIEETDPMVVFISTGEPELDELLSSAVRASKGRAPLVCVVDEPRLNDFNMPAIARMGDITVGVSTGGKSPAMAGILRRRVEKAITRQDVLQVRLQGYIRKRARKSLVSAASRKEFAYKVIRDKTIGALLTKEKYAEARRLAEEMLRKEATRGELARTAPGPSRKRA